MQTNKIQKKNIIVDGCFIAFNNTWKCESSINSGSYENWNLGSITTGSGGIPHWECE